MHKFRKLKIWHQAMTFIAEVYSISNTYPKFEMYGLIDQIRRAAASIALNIAEGSGSGSDKEFSRFLQIALRSVYEVITAIEIAMLLNYGSKDKNEQLIKRADEIGAMISGLLKK